MSFGRAEGAVTVVLYWLSNPLWVGGSLTATTIAALNSFILTRPLGTAWDIVVGLIFTWVTVGIAIVAFRLGKWGPNIGTFVKIAVGFELSNGASEEMHNPKRDVPRMIVGSGIIGAPLYGLVILAIVLVIPRTGLSSVSGFTDAYSAVAGVFHSKALDVVFAVLVIVVFRQAGACPGCSSRR